MTTMDFANYPEKRLNQLQAEEAVVGMAVSSAKAMLHGHGHDVWEMIVENIP